MEPEKQFISVPYQSSNPTCFVLVGLLPGLEINPRCFGQVLHTAGPHYCGLKMLTPIKYLSSDYITIWYIHKRCTSTWSFTSYAPIWDPIKIRWVADESCLKFGVFHSNSTNIDWITNWSIGGERACTSASFLYISYCDPLRTQILNSSQIS